MRSTSRRIWKRLTRSVKPDSEPRTQWHSAIERGRAVYGQDGSWEAALEALRAEGYGMSAAHKATFVVLGVTPNEAFRVVLDSPTWEDCREATIEANESLVAFLREDADEFTGDGVKWSASYDLTKRQRDRRT